MVQSLLHEREIPLHVAEIEGDAVFFYGYEPGLSLRWIFLAGTGTFLLCASSYTAHTGVDLRCIR
jgi:hypothetical protein